MLNDVVFNDGVSAYEDWNIVLTKFDIPFPVPKTSTVDLNGADGVIDLSEVLTGDVKYKNRTATLTFALMDVSNFYDLIGEISNYLHGKIVTFSLSKDDDWYYTGRATINKWECSKQKGSIVITVDCEPYKLAKRESITVVTLNNETKSLNLQNKRKRVYPTISVIGSVVLILDDKEYNLSVGTQQLIGFSLNEGFNKIKLRGSGTVKITYRMGEL